MTMTIKITFMLFLTAAGFFVTGQADAGSGSFRRPAFMMSWGTSLPTRLSPSIVRPGSITRRRPARIETSDLTCSQPYQPLGTAWCDLDEARYADNTFCLAEPVEDEDSLAVDQ